jgi:hypothetical protein
MSTSEGVSEERRVKLFAIWEEIGVSVIRQDLATGGYIYVGGPPEVRKLAREWVRIKENETFTAKPEIWGFSVNLKAAWTRFYIWLKRRR